MVELITTTEAAIEAKLDEIIWRPDLCSRLKVQSECLRRWIKSGKLPAPDVALTRRTMGWRMSTLHAAGIMLV